jgi:chemotaxis protein MotB
MQGRQYGEKSHEIIIKRRAKKSYGEAHGGAWKVAFADFTLAMMALFMVLWIVQPQNKAQTTAAYLMSNPLVDGGAGIFEGNSRTPLELDGIPVQVNSQQDKNNEALTPQDQSFARGETVQLQELAGLMESLAFQMDAVANIEVQIVPQGLRILIKDDQQRFMFERGSAQLNAHFQNLLGRLAGVLTMVDNKLIISGHTDSTPYRKNSSGYNNWNLSGDRALRARNVMVGAGLSANTVLQVTAQADGMPLRADAREDGSNRRIEILLLTVQAEALYRELFGSQQLRVDYSEDRVELVIP